MTNLFLEYIEEEVEVSQDSDDSENISENSKFTHFLPLYLYKNEAPDTLTLDIDLKVSNAIEDQQDKFHLVIVRYCTQNEDYFSSGNWYIMGLYTTRREARDVALKIEDGNFETSEDMPWKAEDTTLEHVEIYTLNLED